MPEMQTLPDKVPFELDGKTINVFAFKVISTGRICLFADDRTMPYSVYSVPDFLIDFLGSKTSLKTTKKSGLRKFEIEQTRQQRISSISDSAQDQELLVRIAAETSNTLFNLSIDATDYRWKIYIFKSKLIFRGSLDYVLKKAITEFLSKRVPFNGNANTHPKPFRYS